MILTDKTLRAFNKWNYDNDFGYIDHEPTSLVVHFEDLDENLRNNIIIDFFDSVGMIINIKRYVMPLGEVEWYYIITGDNGSHLNNHVSEESRSLLDCRKEITKKAIIHANKIYNETKV